MERLLTLTLDTYFVKEVKLLTVKCLSIRIITKTKHTAKKQV